MFSKDVLISIFLFLLLLLTRFYGLHWGNNYFFHPDENNMGLAVSRLNSNDLDPHFYAYGQFPLYLTFYSQKLIGISNSFETSIYILRFWSAIFSVLTILILYKIYSSKIFFLLLIFTPGLIQLAHFGTTESLLLLIFVSIIYLSSTNQYKIAAIICGIGIATKISSLIFIFPLFFSILKNKKYLSLIQIIPIIIITSIIFSPYNLLNFSEFYSALKYETEVATGALSVFYTQQFKTTLPYIFQFTHIFPYVFGLPIFIFAIVGIRFIPKSYTFYLILSSCLIYFLYFGQTYVKWTRFMSPLFFLFPLLASLLINHQKNIFKLILTSVCLIPGIIYFSNYFNPDIRVQASSWIQKNIPNNSSILSESGNVVNLPLSGLYKTTNYDFYSGLSPSNISDYDYILIPSRRVFKNNFTPLYHQQLFSGNLGFKLIKNFTPPPELFLTPENAEETWSVFDRPTVRIFKKNIL